MVADAFTTISGGSGNLAKFDVRLGGLFAGAFSFLLSFALSSTFFFCCAMTSSAIGNFFGAGESNSDRCDSPCNLGVVAILSVAVVLGVDLDGDRSGMADSIGDGSFMFLLNNVSFNEDSFGRSDALDVFFDRRE